MENEEIKETENKAKYRIRKLTPVECGRLMNFTEKDIKAMQAVNSNSQIYKQCGNSIVTACIIALFSQLGLQGHKKWNDMTDKERYSLIHKGCILENKVNEEI